MNKVVLSIGCMLLALVGLPETRAETIYVDSRSLCKGVCGVDCGGSWSQACAELQAGIDATPAGGEVWVAEGTYTPITLKDKVKVIGGFAGSETNLAASDPAHETYVDGAGISQAVRSANCSTATELRGFIIRNGVAKGWLETGGGVYLENSSTTFAQCVFTGNMADFAGGAVANHGGGSPTFVNCRFLSNGSEKEEPTPAGGGAVFNHDGKPTFVNCLFYGNKAAEGGAILTLQGTVTLTNCTLTDNAAARLKGGALFDRRGDAVIRNCILWDNRAVQSETAAIFNDVSLGRTTDVAYSNVKGDWPGTGNSDTDPLFVDASKGDYRLQAESPCLDAGQASVLPADVADIGLNGNTAETVPNDLDMKARVQGDTVDMGAYEWHP
jgi:hypothetical protein